jgi:4-carboxymuconolactone decarboxylase
VAEDESRYARGARLLADIHGTIGEAVLESLNGIAPDFARFITEFAFGDVYARPGLDLRSRQIATIAALVTLGHAAPELHVHIKAGLRLGLSREEITEIIMQMAVYAGFPAALNALKVAQEVFTAKKDD